MKATSIQAALFKRPDTTVSAPMRISTPAVDTRLPLVTADLPRLVNDVNRHPEYAGAVKRGRIYMRDFVVHCMNVLAICNRDDAELTDEQFTKFHTEPRAHLLFESPSDWTILTRNFKPIDAYNFNADLMRVRVHSKRDGLRRGYGVSADHPNILVAMPEQKRPARLIFCADCEETYPTAYEVMDKLWRSVVSEQRCFLCLPCFSKRLGRPLELTDFTNGDINTGIRFGYELAMKTIKEIP